MKAIITYLILVGLPILGILGVLQIGSDLIAPVSVGGVWEVTMTSQSPMNVNCGRLQTADKPMQMNVIQSGPFLVLQLDGSEQIVLEGTLSDTTLAASTKAGGSRPSSLQIQAVIDSLAQPDQMHGTMLDIQCSQVITLRAVRLSREASKGG
jgi:hypothetical protein